MPAWSPQQDGALRAVSKWIRWGGPQVYRLFGYAGTGKTTLARTLASEVDGKVIFAAFTGKAASVLKAKGCDDARTIHSLIYRLDRENQGDPTFKLNRDSDIKDAELVIIDECSMVGEDLGADLLSFGKPVLVLGDPAQLPPVKGGGFFTEAEPDVMLTEIHRQASENPIIRLSTIVRTGGEIEYGTYGDSRVIPYSEIDTDEVLGADQVLVGLNATRHRTNARIREERGFTKTIPGYSAKFPIKGERLVCLRNNREKGLLNGGLWDVMNWSAKEGDKTIDMIVAPADGAGEGQQLIKVRKEFFTGKEKDLQWFERKSTDEFDYGYALTVHKAQGSQWDNVFLFDESRAVTRNDPETSRRWLYTGLTRAAENVIVAR